MHICSTLLASLLLDSGVGSADCYSNYLPSHYATIMKESIVLNAWELITRYHSLKKLNFLPSFVGMLWLFMILIYQITFTYVYVFHKKDEVLSVLAKFAHTDYFTEVIITMIAIFVLYMVLEPIANGGIIQMIDTYRKTN